MSTNSTQKKRAKTGGRTKGTPNKATADQKELERQFKQAIASELMPIATALLARCKGVDHLMAKDKSGQWVSVTDPKLMVKVMNGPEEYRRLSAKDPDVNAIREALNRLFGQAKQSIEVEDVTPTTEMTDAELLALAKELLK